MVFFIFIVLNRLFWVLVQLLDLKFCFNFLIILVVICGDWQRFFSFRCMFGIWFGCRCSNWLVLVMLISVSELFSLVLILNRVMMVKCCMCGVMLFGVLVVFGMIRVSLLLILIWKCCVVILLRMMLNLLGLRLFRLFWMMCLLMMEILCFFCGLMLLISIGSILFLYDSMFCSLVNGVVLIILWC